MAIYTLGPVFLNDGGDGTLLDQCEEIGYDDGLQRLLAAADGQVDPTWSATTMQSPGPTFATTDLNEALALNSAKFLFKGLELSASLVAELYYQQAQHGHELYSGAHHLKLAVNKGMLVPRGLVANHGQGLARLAVGVVPVYDGSNDPIVISSDQALPGTPAVSCGFGVGPVTLTGAWGSVSLDDEVLGISFDPGIALRTVGGGSKPWPFFTGIRARRPTFTLRLSDMGVLATLGLAGKALTSGVIYLRAFERASACYADASEQHVKITLYQGAARLSTSTVNQGGDTEPTIIVEPTKASGNEIMTVQTGQAIV